MTDGTATMAASTPDRSRTQRGSRLAGWALALPIVVVVLFQADQRQALAGGVGTGAFYGALALAVVLTHRATGVVNFSVGATAMFAGYVYNDIRETGKIFVPPLPNPLAPVEWLVSRITGDHVELPNCPTQISLGSPQGVAISFLAAILASALLGAGLHLFVFRPLRNAPPLSKVVASVGLTLLLQAVITLRFTSTAQSVAPIFIDRRIEVAGLRLSLAQLVLAGIVIGVTLLFWAGFRYTRAGLAIRASAENEAGAIILGYSPDLLAGVSWVVSTIVAGTLGVLLASVNGSLDPDTMPLLIVPAMAAALVGRFASFGVAAGAAFVLAMSQSWIQLLTTKSWFPQVSGRPLPGLVEAVPLVVIVLALIVGGQSIPGRGVLAPGRLPLAPPIRRGPVLPLASAGACIVALLLVGSAWRVAATNSIIGAIVCMSLVVLTGFAGQISLGQMAFAGMSGFAVAKVASGAELPMPVGLAVGAAGAALVGTLFALPALRIRGVQLAVVSLAAAVAIEQFVFSNEVWAGRQGGAVVPPPRLFGLELGPHDPYAFGDGSVPNPLFGVSCLVVLLGVVFIVRNIRRSQLGSHMLAVRTNERAAAAIGVDTARTKLVAFVIGSLIAGAGGALQGYGAGVVTPDEFGALSSVAILAFAYLGGISSIGGALLAGVLVPEGLMSAAARTVLGDGSSYLLILGGLAVIVNTVRAPEGVSGLMRAAAHRRRRRAQSLTPREHAQVSSSEPSPLLQVGDLVEVSDGAARN